MTWLPWQQWRNRQAEVEYPIALHSTRLDYEKYVLILSTDKEPHLSNKNFGEVLLFSLFPYLAAFLVWPLSCDHSLHHVHIKRRSVSAQAGNLGRCIAFCSRNAWSQKPNDVCPTTLLVMTVSSLSIPFKSEEEVCSLMHWKATRGSKRALNIRQVPQPSSHREEHTGLPICFSDGWLAQVDLVEGNVVLLLFHLSLAFRNFLCQPFLV